MLLILLIELNFSIPLVILPLRLIPAVSTICSDVLLVTSIVSILSLVVPGTSLTIDRSLLIKEFSNIDFPVFGRPESVILIGVGLFINLEFDFGNKA